MTVYLGLDYGKRRIGVSCGDDERGIAFAVGTHQEGRDGSVITFLSEIISERGVKQVVVGLPLRSDGSEGELAVDARGFAALVEQRLHLPVVLWDERYSSQEADRWLTGKKKKAREDRDALAAEIILQSYLDHLARESGS